MSRFVFLLVFIFTILFIGIIGFLDYQILTPSLHLPDDVCYYHTTKVPRWVYFFYMDYSGHLVAMSMQHQFILFCVSFTLGTFAGIKTDRWRIKSKSTNE